jgi:hypothetical protein
MEEKEVSDERERDKKWESVCGTEKENKSRFRGRGERRSGWLGEHGWRKRRGKRSHGRE